MKKILSAALLSLTCASVNAGIIFSDNFDSEAGIPGISDTNYTGFANWTVTNGSVDIVSQGGWGLNCAGSTGKCVDLDGSSGVAGTLTSSDLTLAAGSYTLSFDISGSQRIESAFDEMQVSLGGFVNESIERYAPDQWETITRDFTVTSATTDVISFNHFGGDYMGIMLDNVSLSYNDQVSVNEPGTIALLGLGLLGLGAARRKQQA